MSLDEVVKMNLMEDIRWIVYLDRDKGKERYNKAIRYINENVPCSEKLEYKAYLDKELESMEEKIRRRYY